jgi:hypothetical protein
LRKRAGQAEARESITKFTELPTALQTAQRQVGKLVSTAEAAVAGKRPGEALYLAGELKRAIETLNALHASGSEVQDLEQFVGRWKEAQAASGELAEKSRNLDSLKRELANVERQLGLQRQQRERDIRAALADAEHATA